MRLVVDNVSHDFCHRDATLQSGLPRIATKLPHFVTNVFSVKRKIVIIKFVRTHWSTKLHDDDKKEMNSQETYSFMTPKTTMLLLIILLVSLGACSVSRSGVNKYTIRDKDGNSYQVMTMPDGKDWTTENINLEIPESFCYDSLEFNCDRYGRLYTWKTAAIVCDELGEGWRLPTNDEWKGLAKHYGGVFGDSNDNGKASYIALMDGGTSQFNALLGGGSDPNGGYKRIEAHGFYWTSTEASDSTAWFGNFGKGRPALYLQNDGEKVRAFAVRCVKGIR